MYTKSQYQQVATIIRNQYQTHGSMNLAPYKQMNRAVEEMAIDFASMFKDDNPRFNPIQFLDACSPDPDRYPFSELWDEDATA